MGLFDIFRKQQYTTIEPPAWVCDINSKKGGDIDMMKTVEEIVAKEFFAEEFASLTSKKEKIAEAIEIAKQNAIAEVEAKFAEINKDIEAGLKLYSVIIAKEIEVADEEITIEVAQGV